MAWFYNTQSTATIIIPLAEVGTPLDFTVSFTADKNTNDSYLFVAETNAIGLFMAKKSTDVTYVAVGGPYTSACSLGKILTGETIELNIRINATLDAQEGYYLARLCIGSGFASVIMPGGGTGEEDFLAVWRDDPTIWQDEPVIWE